MALIAQVVVNQTTIRLRPRRIVNECLCWLYNFSLTVRKAEDKIIDVPENERISVSPGDYIGWYV